MKTKKWDSTGEITEIRVAFDNKIVSYEILVNGNNAIRHRKYLRKIPENVFPESVDVPVLAEDERFFFHC